MLFNKDEMTLNECVNQSTDCRTFRPCSLSSAERYKRAWYTADKGGLRGWFILPSVVIDSATYSLKIISFYLWCILGIGFCGIYICYISTHCTVLSIGLPGMLSSIVLCNLFMCIWSCRIVPGVVWCALEITWVRCWSCDIKVGNDGPFCWSHMCW